MSERSESCRIRVLKWIRGRYLFGRAVRVCTGSVVMARQCRNLDLRKYRAVLPRRGLPPGDGRAWSCAGRQNPIAPLWGADPARRAEFPRHHMLFDRVDLVMQR